MFEGIESWLGGMLGKDVPPPPATSPPPAPTATPDAAAPPAAAVAAPPAASPQAAAPQAAAPPAADGSVTAGAPVAGAAAPAGQLSKDFTIKAPAIGSKTIKALGGKIEIEIKFPAIELAGKALLVGEGNSIDEKALAAEAVRRATDWGDKEVAPTVEGAGLFKENEAKLDFGGPGLGCKFSTVTAIGKFEMAVTFVGIDKKLTKDGLSIGLKVTTVGITVAQQRVHLNDYSVGPLKFTGLSLNFSIEAEIKPNYVNILADWAKEKGEQQLESYAEKYASQLGEEAIAVISLDAIIVGSIVILGAATIGVSIGQVISGWEIGDLSKSYTPAVASAQAGFLAAMKSSGAPGDQFGKVGYDVGRQNFDKVLAEARGKNPGVPDDILAQAIAKQADQALQQVSGAIDSAVREGMWNGYLGANKRYLTQDSARYAFIACFNGVDPNFDSLGPLKRHWDNYCAQHPTLSKL